LAIEHRAGLLIAVLLAALLAGGCVQRSVKRVNSVPAAHAEQEIASAELLDVSIAAFDPGIPEGLKEQEAQRVFPVVRKAEAQYIPYVLRQTLEGTGYWGAVRVVPETGASVSDVNVSGKILKSDGAVLALNITARDATGRVWFNRKYEETAAELAYSEKLPDRADPFQDLYSRIANDLLAERRKLAAAELKNIQRVSDLRFATDLSPQRFAGYLAQDKSGRYSVARLPPAGDPILAKVDAIRERDESLLDTLDMHYGAFRDGMSDPYFEWRKASYTEAAALREVENQAFWRKALGAAAVVGGVVAMSKGGELGSVAGQVGIIGGIYGIQSGFGKSSDAKMHVEALKELGASLEADVQPQVVQLEGKTVTLTGSAEAQYEQWRKMLRQMYAAETGLPATAPASGTKQGS
jgi:hypothetical protein